MHIAKLFENKTPDDFLVMIRKWPVHEKVGDKYQFDFKFAEHAVIVMYDRESLGFKFLNCQQILSQRGFEKIEKKYCQDRAWVLCKTNYRLKKKDRERKKISSLMELSRPNYRIAFKNGVIEVKKCLPDPDFSKVKLLRV